MQGLENSIVKRLFDPVLSRVFLPELHQTSPNRALALPVAEPHERGAYRPTRCAANTHEVELVADAPFCQSLQRPGGEGGLAATALTGDCDFPLSRMCLCHVGPPLASSSHS